MKRLNKKTGIAIFTAVMAILAVIILVYHNPLANPQDELLKKVHSFPTRRSSDESEERRVGKECTFYISTPN